MSYRKKVQPGKVEQPQAREPQTHSDSRFLNPATECILSTSQLTSGLPYQRSVKQKNVNALIRKWNSLILEPLVVSFRDGRFYLVDGQHRVCAMRQMNDGKDVMVLCKVHTGLTYEEEADLCYQLDQSKKRLTMSQSTKVLEESGKSAELEEIRALMEQNGFTWAHGKCHAKVFEIVATQAVLKAYRLLGNTTFSRMLYLLNSTWHGDPTSVSGTFLSGMALFLKTYQAELSDHTFIKRLTDTSPESIIQIGKQDYSTNQRALRCARAILNQYNAYGGRGLTYQFKD